MTTSDTPHSPGHAAHIPHPWPALDTLSDTFARNPEHHLDVIRTTAQRMADHPGIIHVDIDDALRRATRAHEQLQQQTHQQNHQGEQAAAAETPTSPAPPLFGIPLPAKDLCPVAGWPISYGSARRRTVATDTDPLLARAATRGAILTGITHSSEMGLTAYCEPVGYPPVPGYPDATKTPGGSSGGAALLVADGTAPIAHGTDGGGSLRVPAASTGTVGFKPAHDSRGGQLAAGGFITRTVADAHYAARATGLLPATTPSQPHPPARRIRVGLMRDPLHGGRTHHDVDTDWLNAADSAAHTLAAHGIDIVDIPPLYDEQPFNAFRTILAYRCSKVPTPASPLVEWLVATGQTITTGQLTRALDIYHQLPERIAQAAPGIDFLLTPTLAFDPPPIGYFSALPPEKDFLEQTHWTPWCTLFNMCGFASISVPHGPRSIQLGCLRKDPTGQLDNTLLKLAALLENPTPAAS
ncbi:amidase [Corynebacterium aquilae]|uniref:amidase n=1 Tax=Corynebacterium aquilae TaxID=203263 RepID=UPI0009512029|nr:amidase [Corynebacterium aquilae]